MDFPFAILQNLIKIFIKHVSMNLKDYQRQNCMNKLCNNFARGFDQNTLLKKSAYDLLPHVVLLIAFCFYKLCNNAVDCL